MAVPGHEALAAKHAGDIYARNGETQKAIMAYEQAVKAYPAYAEVYYLMGLIYDLQQGNLEKALTCYQKFLELAPNSPEARDVRLLIESAKQAPPLLPSQASTPAQGSISAQGSTPVFASSSIARSPSPSPPASEDKGESSDSHTSHAVESQSKPNDNRDETAQSGNSQEMVKASDSREMIKSSDVRKEMRSSGVPKIDKKENAASSKNINPVPGIPHSEQPEQFEQFVSRSIDEKVLKYSLKIAVWQREGYIQKFNELAMARGSSLTSNASEERARLREERQKTTEFINYAKEAEYFLQRKMLNGLLKEWGMDLAQLPLTVDLQKAMPSCLVLNMQEDKKYVQLSLEAKIDVKNLKEQILKLGYKFTPDRVQLECSNLYGESKDRFIEAIHRKSECMKTQSEGLYEIYMPAELFALELSKMTIGTYGIHLKSVDRDKIIFSAEPKER